MRGEWKQNAEREETFAKELPAEDITKEEPSEEIMNHTGEENPDEEEWTNTDDPPPDDEGYAEQVQAEDAQAVYEASQIKDEPVAPTVQPQLDEHFTTADGRDMTIAQLLGSLIAELAVNEGFIATTLERTGLWKITENRIETTIESDLDLQMLKKNLPVISSRLSTICGRQIEFIVTKTVADGAQENNASTEIPVQVQVLLNAFKGTVITGK